MDLISGFILAPYLLHYMDMPQMVMLLHGTLITVTLLIICYVIYRNKKASKLNALEL